MTITENLILGVSEILEGPTALALAYDEPAALAKALVDYAKTTGLDIAVRKVPPQKVFALE